MSADEAEDYVSVVNFIIESSYIAGDVYAIQSCVFACQHMQVQLGVVGVASPE